MHIKSGDILIAKGKHSCKVKFVEGADETGVLLVDGVKDEFFAPHELNDMDEKYVLLCRKEDRQDI